ncbi:hypothetical protein, partial [Erwinia sp. PsM31]|uniref:hypothetical protein n=1 Tax=Erwinia sp. PsM31 TaxID=3030535 RepID=UPI00263B0D51
MTALVVVVSATFYRLDILEVRNRLRHGNLYLWRYLCKLSSGDRLLYAVNLNPDSHLRIFSSNLSRAKVHGSDCIARALSKAAIADCLLWFSVLGNARLFNAIVCNLLSLQSSLHLSINLCNTTCNNLLT